MEKYQSMQMEQMLVPDIEPESTTFLNQMRFMREILPMLNAIYQKDPKEYEDLIDKFKETIPNLNKTNFADVLEYCLIYLKNSYGMQYLVEHNQDSYIFESVNCPLVLKQQEKEVSELERKTLCYHCHEFHLRKFFRLFGLNSRLTLYPTGCLVEVEKPRKDKVNPLFY